jgi:lipoprotein signal peptidase/GNAT superfamily N-acetyltransferase
MQRAPSTLRLMIIAATLVGVDQAAKAGVRAGVAPGERIEVIQGVLALVYAPNLRGVSWWVPDVPPWFVTGLTMVLLLILVAAFPFHRFHAQYRRDTAAAALAAVLLAAAAAGHLLDEVSSSFTLDWIVLFTLPAFNLADLYAYGGLVALTVELGRGFREGRGLDLRQRLARAHETRTAFLRFLSGGLRERPRRGAGSAVVRDLAEADCPLYFVCLEDWSPEMREAGGHKAEWYREKRERGLRVKLARDDDGAVAGMIQYLPVEEAPQVEGRGAYFVLCIWVHGHRQGVGDRRRRGIGRALLAEAEADARRLGATGMAAWGLMVPVWMRARWFRKHGYRPVERDGMAMLVWKPFEGGAEPPRWVRPRRPVEPGRARVQVTAFVSGWCPALNLAAERARRAALTLEGAVDFELVNTRPPEVRDAWGIADGVFVDGRRLSFGPPPSYQRVLRTIVRAVRRRARQHPSHPPCAGLPT